LTRFKNVVESPCYARLQISTQYTFVIDQPYLCVCPNWYSNGFERLTEKLL